MKFSFIRAATKNIPSLIDLCETENKETSICCRTPFSSGSTPKSESVIFIVIEIVIGTLSIPRRTRWRDHDNDRDIYLHYIDSVSSPYPISPYDTQDGQSLVID